jgi:hypothetical protein
MPEVDSLRVCINQGVAARYATDMRGNTGFEESDAYEGL